MYTTLLAYHSNKKGFTILELMVGIVVFTLGFLGAYLLIDTANNASIRSRDEIIGANIMREQIELLKNLRDTNWLQFRFWDSIESTKSPTELDKTLQANNFYAISNDFRSDKTIHIEKIPGMTLTPEGVLQEFQKNNSLIRLCIDTLGRYTNSCTPTGEKTNFASFLFIESLITHNTQTNTPIPVEKSYKATAFFVSFNKGYHITSMSTIITDWKNQ